MCSAELYVNCTERLELGRQPLRDACREADEARHYSRKWRHAYAVQPPPEREGVFDRGPLFREGVERPPQNRVATEVLLTVQPQQDPRRLRDELEEEIRRPIGLGRRGRHEREPPPRLQVEPDGEPPLVGGRRV